MSESRQRTRVRETEAATEKGTVSLSEGEKDHYNATIAMVFVSADKAGELESSEMCPSIGS